MTRLTQELRQRLMESRRLVPVHVEEAVNNLLKRTLEFRDNPNPETEYNARVADIEAFESIAMELQRQRLLGAGRPLPKPEPQKPKLVRLWGRLALLFDSKTPQLTK